MKESGFEVDDKQLWIGIDSKLPSSGYFYPAGDESVILVSAWAVYNNDEDLTEILIHEMCHVYLTQKKHPSHNPTVETRVSRSMVKEFANWQSNIIRSVLGYPAEVPHGGRCLQGVSRITCRVGKTHSKILRGHRNETTTACHQSEARTLEKRIRTPS